jgi:carbon monoxide dehydrogenase subunit G
VIRPSFAFVRGTLELSILVTEAVPDQSVGLHLRTKGIGNTSTVEALLTLAPQAAGTHVHWRAQVTEMGGLLKMVPEGLVRGAAQKVIADVWTAVEAHLRD